MAEPRRQSVTATTAQPTAPGPSQLGPSSPITPDTKGSSAVAGIEVSETDHQPALDGVRGVAVLLVMVFHIWRTPVTALGWSGVDLFFVLSGFLITGILWDTRARPNRARSFYTRRALRILPLYYGVLIAVFVVRPLLGLAHRRDDLVLAGEQLWYWTYLSDWRIALDHPHGATLLTHFWSLSIEEQFYLAWPFLVWRVSRRALLAVAGTIAAAAAILRLYIVLATSMPEAAYALLPCRLDALAVGAIVALAIRRPGGAASVRRWLTPVAGLAAIVVGILALVRPSVGFVDPGMMTVGYTALDWAFAGMVLAAAVGSPPILTLGVLRAAGRYSYGLYVYHPLVMWWMVRNAPAIERSEWGSGLAVAAVSVLVAVLSYHLYEQPFLRLKQRWAPRVPNLTGISGRSPY